MKRNRAKARNRRASARFPSITVDFNQPRKPRRHKDINPRRQNAKPPFVGRGRAECPQRLSGNGKHRAGIAFEIAQIQRTGGIKSLWRRTFTERLRSGRIRNGQVTVGGKPAIDGCRCDNGCSGSKSYDLTGYGNFGNVRVGRRPHNGPIRRIGRFYCCRERRPCALFERERRPVERYAGNSYGLRNIHFYCNMALCDVIPIVGDSPYHSRTFRMGGYDAGSVYPGNVRRKAFPRNGFVYCIIRYNSCRERQSFARLQFRRIAV